MVIAAASGDSWSVPSLSSVRTAPESVANIRTPWKLLVWSWSSKRPPPKRTPIVPHQRSLTRERFGDEMVVNQSGFTNADRDHRKGLRVRPARGRQLLKSSRVDKLRILELDKGFEGQAGCDPGSETNWVALAGRVGFGRLAKRGADARRRIALRSVEVDVARAERQAVRLPDGGHHLDLHAQVEVAHQPLHDRDLLGILLAEVG